MRHLVTHGVKPRADGRMIWKRDPAILKGVIPNDLWSTVRRIKAPTIYILGGASATALVQS